MTHQIANKFPDIPSGLQSVLQQIVDDVVKRLGWVGALVATLDHGKSLSIRAFAIDAPPEQLKRLEGLIDLSQIGIGEAINLGDKRYIQNLGTRVANRVDDLKDILVSDRLYDLLRPFISESVADQIQEELEITQLVAAPFLVKDELVGILFAAAHEPISNRDIDFMEGFSHQAATAIQSQQQLTAMEALQRVTLLLQNKMVDETGALQVIVDAIVDEMGYPGAIVATLESGNTLPVRAYAVPAASNLLEELEKKAGVSLKGLETTVYLDDDQYKDNLCVRATKVNGSLQKHIITSELYDLLRPIFKKSLADLTQELVGIKNLIAIPFFLEEKIVGNLFVGTRRSNFSAREISVLTAFGQQAAISIHNARLYRMAEERRKIAQRFGRMAFSATASIHALRNHVGAVRSYMYLLQMLPELSLERREEILNKLPLITDRLSQVTNILDNLHEPWHHISDHPVDVNGSLMRALREVFPGIALDMELKTLTVMGISVHLSLTSNLPRILTASDMLAETFRILVKNAVEAILTTEKGSDLWISSDAISNSMVEITIRDSGRGIKQENLDMIFEMGWSTKDGRGMGFGLFWARDFVIGLGGNIRVHSVWKQGATFRIQLPAIR